MDTERCLDEILKHTIEKASFKDMEMSEIEFAQVIKTCQSLLDQLKKESGAEACDELLDMLSERDEWNSVAQLVESLLYDD